MPCGAAGAGGASSWIVASESCARAPPAQSASATTTPNRSLRRPLLDEMGRRESRTASSGIRTDPRTWGRTGIDRSDGDASNASAALSTIKQVLASGLDQFHVRAREQNLPDTFEL